MWAAGRREKSAMWKGGLETDCSSELSTRGEGKGVELGGRSALEYGDENTAVFPMWPKLHINEPGMSCFQKSHACLIPFVWGGGGGRRR